MKKPKTQFLLLFGLAAAACGLALVFAAGSHLHFAYTNGAFSFDARFAAGDSSAGTLLLAAAVGAILGAGLVHFADENSVPGADDPGRPVQTAISEVGRFLRGLHRSKRDTWIGGVCGGLGEGTPLPSWAWRLAFLAAFFAYGFGFAAYLLLWICLPNAPE
jgi:phage shock protein PspC (stress-responsive transcriptional regulator)